MRVLVYRLGSLGDTLLALPALRVVRARFPNARIVALTNKPVNTKAPPLIAVVENSGLIDEAINYPIGVRSWSDLMRLRTELASMRFDLAVNLAAPRGKLKSARDYLFLKSCNIPKVVGTPWCRGDVECLREPATGLYTWEASRLLRRVRSLGTIDLASDAAWDLQFTRSEQATAQRLLEEAAVAPGFFAISVGTKVDVKDWSEPNWLELVRRLAKRHPQIPLVAVGSEEEWARTERCLRLWPGRTLNLCGLPSVRTIAAVLRSARLFIGHDSGPMHLAGTVGVPCVAIFAARNLPGQWFPRGESNTVLYHQTACFGCELEVCAVHNKKCIRDIRVPEVMAAVAKYLVPAGPA